MKSRTRRGGVILLLVLLILGTALVLALASARSGQGHRLDPGNPAPGGGRALAQILQDQGVDVHRVTRSGDLRDQPSTTVLVSGTEALGPRQLRALQRLQEAGIALVLVEPSQDVLDALAPSITLAGTVSDDVSREPQCSVTAATAAGRVLGGGYVYRGAGGDRVCYPTADDARTGTYVVAGIGSGPDPIVVVTPGDVIRYPVTVIGQGDLLTNEHLATEGDAALALQTLGGGTDLTWYVPDPLENGSADGDQSLLGLLPSWVWWSTAQLGVVLLLVMVWRGRRLGKLVYEPLPVVVSAAETQLGRARLYRQARARGRAADTLRTASLRRLAHRLAAPQAAGPAELVQLVAAAIGRPEPEVGHVLLGPPPATDLELVQLASHLDDIEALAAGTSTTTAGAGRP